MKSRRAVCTAVTFALAAATISGPSFARDIMGATGMRGAGSTFAYPIIAKWSREYRAMQARGGDYPGAFSGLDDPPTSSALDYEPIGSLAGTQRVRDRAVDFGASDVPLPTAELTRLDLVQFPIVIGGIVAAINIEGVRATQLRLTGALLADIFSGKLSRWSDPAIQSLNPSLRLPDVPIAVVHRSDGSGTTFNFTDYLSKVSPQWHASIGSDLLVKWPIGVGVKGNDGVAQAVKRTANSIGYVDYAQALQTKLVFAQLQNREGEFVTPGIAGFQAAAANANWSSTNGFYNVLTNVAGNSAYPIVATVYVLMPKNGAPRRTGPVMDLFEWSLEKGQAHAQALGYVPLPASLVKQIETHWAVSFAR